MDYSTSPNDTRWSDPVPFLCAEICRPSKGMNALFHESTEQALIKPCLLGEKKESKKIVEGIITVTVVVDNLENR